MIGLVGLGTMGREMARHVRRLETVLAYDARPAALEHADPLLTRCGTLADVAAATIIILSLPGPPQSRSVIRELGPRLQRGSILVDTTTIDPATARDLGLELEGCGAMYVHAPVIGGQVGAQAGTLTVIAGGPPEGLARIRRLVDAFGKDVAEVDSAPTAATLKLLNNFMSLGNTVVLMEALAIASASGVAAKLVHDVLKTGSGYSNAFERRWRVNLQPRDFKPGFAVDLAVKDLTLASEHAEAVGVPTFAGSLALNMYRLLQRNGFGGSDVSALMQWWEDQLKLQITPD